MHDSESRLVAILYRVKDLHLLLPAGFYRRVLCVCLWPIKKKIKLATDTHRHTRTICPADLAEQIQSSAPRKLFAWIFASVKNSLYLHTHRYK